MYTYLATYYSMHRTQHPFLSTAASMTTAWGSTWPNIPPVLLTYGRRPNPKGTAHIDLRVLVSSEAA